MKAFILSLIVGSWAGSAVAAEYTYSGIWDGDAVKVTMDIDQHGNITGSIRGENSDAAFDGKNISNGKIRISLGYKKIDYGTYTLTKTDNGTSIVWTSNTKKLVFSRSK